jgi:hypothetical protein
MVCAAFAACVAFSSRTASAEVLTCQPSGAPFARGFCALLHSSDPEGWIRASAELDKSTGSVSLKTQVETDSVLAGPRGTASVSFLDSRGAERAVARINGDVSRKGKSCGRADPCGITTFHSTLSIPPTLAQEITSMKFVVEQHGKDVGTAIDLAAVAVEVTSASTLKQTVASLDQHLAPSMTSLTIEGEPAAADPRVTLSQMSRIIGGNKVPIGAYPWMAALFKPSGGRFVQECGGTLIRPTWVLTAAHCHVGKDWLVVLGRTDLSNPNVGEVDRVVSVVPNGSYNAVTQDSDIALVQLEKQSAITRIATATGAPLAAATSMLVTGWGVTQENGASTVMMRQVDVALISHDSCASSYAGKLTSMMLCAGQPNGGKDACQGDSGGPLFRAQAGDPAAFVQYGVVSWGDGCARADRPGVYVDVAKFDTWIAQTAR